jgi:hypothetical protein
MSANFTPNRKHAFDLVLDVPRPLFAFQLGLQGLCHDGGETFARQFGKTGGKLVRVLTRDIQLRAHKKIPVERLDRKVEWREDRSLSRVDLALGAWIDHAGKPVSSS